MNRDPKLSIAACAISAKDSGLCRVELDAHGKRDSSSGCITAYPATAYPAVTG